MVAHENMRRVTMGFNARRIESETKNIKVQKLKLMGFPF